MPSGANTASRNAAILGPAGLEALDVNQAMDKVRAALSGKSAASYGVYAVLVYGKDQRPAELDSFAAVNTVLKAYWQVWRLLSRLNIKPPSTSHEPQKVVVPGAAGMCVYWGNAAAKLIKAQEIKARRDASSAVYLIPSHLDPSLLGSMDLPQLPEPFRKLQVVIQVEMPHHAAGAEGGSKEWNPWNSLARQVAAERKAEDEIQKDTLAWRKEFMSEYESWTSAEVAAQSGSAAKNAAAMASRWVLEGKIFSVKFEGKNWFPRFQFQDGSPIPAVADVIGAFPKHSTGWDLAFFFTNPNSYLGGRKPVDILRSDPDKVTSLAQTFAHPADVF